MAVRTTCLLCGDPLPKPKWYAWMLGPIPPTHDPHGPQGESCWYKFNAKIGVKDPGPPPSRKSGGSW
jgi:hypothetical protein